jgi:hypothetical protein
VFIELPPHVKAFDLTEIANDAIAIMDRQITQRCPDTKFVFHPEPGDWDTRIGVHQESQVRMDCYSCPFIPEREFADPRMARDLRDVYLLPPVCTFVREIEAYANISTEVHFCPRAIDSIGDDHSAVVTAALNDRCLSVYFGARRTTEESTLDFLAYGGISYFLVLTAVFGFNWRRFGAD